MKITQQIDQELAHKLAAKMLECNLWWSYRLIDSKEEIIASPALQKILGKEINSIDDLMGKYATPLPRLKIVEALSNHASGKKEVSRFVVSFETSSGKRSYQNQLQQINEDSEVTFLITCADVTEMVEFEREIVDAQGRLSISQVYEKQELLENQNQVIKESYAKQSRFLGLLSHELRSPLLGISSLVKRLRDKCENNSDVERMLKTISMTAQQSTYLVNDILTYTQAEYDGLKLHPSQTSLLEILDNVKQLTKSLANDKSLNLSVIKLVENDEVFVDSVRLTQILNNLIINGIKFTEYGGVNIEVTELTKRNYQFIVSDSGEGIPASSLDKIFKPFAQIEAEYNNSSMGSRYLGAGLGLFVVKELIHAMGGTIHVTSQEKVGTQFEFTLNLSLTQQTNNFKLETLENIQLKQAADVELDSKTLTDDTKSELKTDLSQLKILIADDSAINRMVLVGYLDDLNCQVIEAVDGRDAWRKIQNNQFDYVMLDIQMPWLDGLEVAKKLYKLKSDGQYKSLKGVFAITAGGEVKDFDEEEDLVKENLFDKWLIKPVSKSQITCLLTTNLDNGVEQKENTKPSSNVGLKNACKKIDVEPGNNDQDQTKMALTEPHKSKAKSTTSTSVTQKDSFDKKQIPETFHHLIEPFTEEMEKNLIKLRELNEHSELILIKELAHYIKGNAMLFQLDSLVESCKELENINAKQNSLMLSDSQRIQQTNELIESIENTRKAIVKAFLT